MQWHYMNNNSMYLRLSVTDSDVIMRTSSSLVLHNVVIMTTSGADSVVEVAIMVVLGFQYTNIITGPQMSTNRKS